MVKCPVKALQIGPYEIAIKPLAKNDAADNWGLYLPYKYEMRLGDFPNKAKAAEVTLHEIMHVIWQERGLKKGMPEETIVTQMAMGLLAVLRVNPKLSKWLWECF